MGAGFPQMPEEGLIGSRGPITQSHQFTALQAWVTSSFQPCRTLQEDGLPRVPTTKKTHGQSHGKKLFAVFGERERVEHDGSCPLFTPFHNFTCYSLGENVASRINCLHKKNFTNCCCRIRETWAYVYYFEPPPPIIFRWCLLAAKAESLPISLTGSLCRLCRKVIK